MIAPVSPFPLRPFVAKASVAARKAIKSIARLYRPCRATRSPGILLAISRSSRESPLMMSLPAAAFDAKLAAVGGAVSTGGRGGRGGGPPPVPNFAALAGYETEEGVVLTSLNGQLKTLDFGDMAPNDSKYHAWMTACSDLQSAVKTWQAINSRDVAVLNAVLTKNSIKPLAPASGFADPVCGQVSPSRPQRRSVKAP